MTDIEKTFGLCDVVRAFGGSEKHLLVLEGREPGSEVSAFEYQDLFQANSPLLRELDISVSGVVEVEGRPLLYMIRRDVLTRSSSVSKKQEHFVIASLSRLFACRGHKGYLAIVEPGRLTLHPCTFRDSDFFRQGSVFKDTESPALIQDLSQGIIPRPSLREKQIPVHDLLLETLNKVTDDLQKSPAFAHLPEEKRNAQTLALVGRALFSRFLVDREILSEEPAKSLLGSVKKPENWFDDASSAASLCAWLDVSFNGEFLPLFVDSLESDRGTSTPVQDVIKYKNYFKRLLEKDPQVLWPLGLIMSHADVEGQLPLWNFIDFAHVPVGLLSEVYEDFMHRYDPEGAKNQSVFYTPGHIAEMLVNQAFAGLGEEVRHKAKILDPAAGAGVFLVLCLRRLIKERWIKKGKCPDTKEIREILYEQIRGFDINPNALILATLSLYLTAVEMDPNPFPPEKLYFPKRLLGDVLVNVSEAPEKPGLGSLGKHVGREYDGQFDLVIGNPPWSNKKQDPRLNHVAEDIARRVVERRANEVNDENFKKHLAEYRYENPDRVPDLPFVWRSMEWAKPNGVLVFALHARLLFKRTDSAQKARVPLFRALRVTGIINGTALREVPSVWPKIKAHFCFLFARNEVPYPNDAFQYVSVLEEKLLNDQSRLRIDPHQVEFVQFNVLEEDPWILKALFRGNGLDVAIVRRLQRLMKLEERGSSSFVSLKKYWKSKLNLSLGKGYQTGGDKDDGEPLISQKAKKFESKDKSRFKHYINTENLELFDYERLHNIRDVNIYKAPLVVCGESLGPKDPVKVRVTFDEGLMAFSESFIGLSAHGHKFGQELTCYLFLLLKSEFFEYFNLITSSKYGVERYTILAEDVYAFPIKEFDQLSGAQIEELNRFSTLLEEGALTQALIDEWVYSLYEVSDREREVIRDTLAINLPYEASRKRAQERPGRESVIRFCDIMMPITNGLIRLVDDEVEVRPVGDEGRVFSKAWLFVDIRRKGGIYPEYLPDHVLNNLGVELAEQEGSSLMILNLAPGLLRLGMLAQYRYWTPSRARLCAQDVVGAWNDAMKIWETSK